MRNTLHFFALEDTRGLRVFYMAHSNSAWTLFSSLSHTRGQWLEYFIGHISYSTYIPSLRKSNGFLQPGWVQCSLFSIEGVCGRYPKHAPKSGFSAIRKECNGENSPSFTVVRVHVVRGCMPICRKIVLGFFALGGLHHPPGRGGVRGASMAMF